MSILGDAILSSPFLGGALDVASSPSIDIDFLCEFVQQVDFFATTIDSLISLQWKMRDMCLGGLL